MLKIGLLGAARITPAAVIAPASTIPGVQVTAVAARDPVRARRFAQRHGIPVVHQRYADLLADPEIEAVYNPLPNSLHCQWTVRALEAGKHVLCEKPIASNAQEASRMSQCAQDNGRILMEAFHYRYHPLAERLRILIASGAIGAVRHMEIHMCTTLRRRDDIRLQYDLAGGAMMDLGCYAVHMARFLTDAEPAVQSATAKLWSPQVDASMDAVLLFPGEVTARISCSFFTSTLLRIQASIHGELGQIRVVNPVLPHYFHWIELRLPARRRWEHVAGDTTYAHQLRAFACAVETGVAPSTGGRDAIANMRVIDDIYGAAGLSPRGS